MNPLLKTDYYKVVHHKAYVSGLGKLTSYWTPRMSRIEGVDKVVMFGLQGLIKEKLIEEYNTHFFNRGKTEVLKEYIRMLRYTMGADYIETKHISDLHDLGYLPIEIKAIAEGERVNIGVPMFEISNTIKGYGWLVNYLETYISCQIWQPMTSATIADRFKKLSEEYYNKTVSEGEREVETACGDFSMRGMSSVDSARTSGAAHLLSFTGTATIPAVMYLEDNYGANIETEVVGIGVPSTEHSVMSSYGREGEFGSYETLLVEKFPTGPLSIVSDTYDYWRVLTEYLPKLKDIILARDGKTIIRGDSGNPIDILCGRKVYKIKDMKEFEAYKMSRSAGFNPVVEVDGRYFKKVPEMAREWVEIEKPADVKGTVEVLWEVFGGTVNDKGYKVLNPKIGTIYGDSITYERAEQIYKRLEAKGFSVSNVTLGIGSYTYQMNTRDTFGNALKATNAIINGEERQIYKDPKTDTGNFKKSQKGMCRVLKAKDGNYSYIDELKEIEVGETELKTVFKNGKLEKETTLKEIKERMKRK